MWSSHLSVTWDLSSKTMLPNKEVPFMELKAQSLFNNQNSLTILLLMVVSLLLRKTTT